MGDKLNIDKKINDLCEKDNLIKIDNDKLNSDLELNIKNIIIDKFGSIRQFAMKIDVPYTTIKTILVRGLKNSNVNNVIKLCNGINISVDELLNNEEAISNLDYDNAKYVNLFSNNVNIPVLGIIKAGTPIEAQEDIIEHIDIPKAWTKGNKTFFALKIKGDSMSPKYNENDIVVFEQINNVSIANKKDCAVMVNGDDATFKNVIISEDGITLVPLNIDNSDDYKPTFYNKKEVETKPVRIIGIAKEKRTRY